jgi:hypothetical protein
MLTSSSLDERDPALAELVEYSSKVSCECGLGRSPDEFYLSPTNWDADIRLNGKAFQEEHTYTHHASPLISLRARDIQTLSELFDTEIIDDIESDIQRYLDRLYPEPCWDENLYDFLGEFL